MDPRRLVPGRPGPPVALAAILFLLLPGTVGCGGPRIKAGNLKERREKMREYREAQRRVEEAEAAREAGAAGETPAGAAEETPAAAPAASPAAPVDTAVLSVLGAPFAVTLAEPGGARRLVLYRPVLAHYEREFLTTGGVEDRELREQAFVFRRDLSLFRRKFKKLDVVEFVPSPGSDRTGIVLRLHFRKAGKKPEEFPLDELVGAGHPLPPSLIGVGPEGTVRLPLLAKPGEDGHRSILQVDFTPEDVDPSEE